MKKELIKSILESLAVGDSLCKCTEFASRSQILEHFSGSPITDYLPPEQGLSHRDMRFAQVTDDTEQNLFILDDYIHSSEITPELAARSLLRWFTETPEPLKYIGPSSLKALKAIQEGADIRTAGKEGTSCGGVMRVPAPFLCSTDLQSLDHNIICTLTPTHNTGAAMEAAFGYGYALYGLCESRNIDHATHMAERGCMKGRLINGPGTDDICLPSSSARLKLICEYLPHITTDDQLLDFLFYSLGTTISSCDVFTSCYALFLWCRSDVYKAVQMAASLGGDTDTIGCLAAVLCCVFGQGHNIPSHIVDSAAACNHIDFDVLADEISDYRRHLNNRT